MISQFAYHRKHTDRNIVVMNINEMGTLSHSHDYFELVYVLDGSAMQNIGGADTRVSKGDYYVIDYDSSHSYSDCRDFRIINCLFKPEFLDKALTGCKDFGKIINNYLIHFDKEWLSRVPSDNVFHDSNGEIRILFESIEQEYNNGDGGYIELMRCRLIEILVMSLRSIYVPPNNRSHSATLRIIQYIDEHYSEHINLGTLCQEMNFSLPYISMRFREDMGISFQKYLQKVRIEQSCRLLAETNEKITHIAHNVGYEDIKFFGKVFRDVMNMSPRAYGSMVKSSIS